MASPRPFRLGVAGPEGQMGRAVLGLIAERADIELAATITRATPVAKAMDGCEAIIDFTSPAASRALAEVAAARGGPALVIGSTGFTAEADAAIESAANRVAIVKSGNFSLGVNLLAQLVEQAARRLSAEDWDIEILEAHHRRKTDAPSGTALMLGEAAARGPGRAAGGSGRAATARPAPAPDRLHRLRLPARRRHRRRAQRDLRRRG